VLFYHFDGADDLLWQAIWKLRERRIASSLAAADVAQPQTLAARVRAVWPALAGEEPPVLDQATGLMRYDPDRYAGPRRGRFAAVHACTATAVLLPAGPARAA